MIVQHSYNGRSGTGGRRPDLGLLRSPDPLALRHPQTGPAAAAPVKAAFFRAHGGLEVLEVGDLPDPELGPGEVRLEVKACALNHLDLFVREGWPGLKLPLPHVGGTDLAGVVAEVAGDVSGVAVGDEVMVNPGLNFGADAHGELIIPDRPSIIGETRWGGLASHCVVPADHLIPKPAAWSWEEAAAFPLTALTVMHMLRKAGVAGGSPVDDAGPDGATKAGARKRVLVVGAGGGIGVMSVQLAKALGAWVYAVTGGTDKAEKVRGLGADHVIDYKDDPDWSKAAYLATDKKGFHAVLDSVGQATWKQSLRSLAVGGRLVTCGATTGPIGETDIRLVFWKQLSIIGATMGTPQDLERALALAHQGRVHPVVDSVWPIEKIQEAQKRMDDGRMFGKIIVTP